MNLAEWIILLLLIADVIYAFVKHGQPQDRRHNFWTSLIVALIMFALYKWAGLF